MTDAPLVFLPGFMGNVADFSPVAQRLNASVIWKQWQWPALNEEASFKQNSQTLWSQFAEVLPETFYLYGYSMGGRVALSWLHNTEFRQRCAGVFIAAGHPGLSSEVDREKRWQHDQHWAQRFTKEPLQQVLAAWYQQPVFASLNETTRAQQITNKLTGDGRHYASQLLALSLAKQPDYRDDCVQFNNSVYVVGEYDKKFKALGRSFCPMSRQINIRNAGHPVHIEQPELLANVMAKQINNWRQ